MSGLDIFIVCVLTWGAWKGWRSGLLRQGFALAGFFLGLWLASMLYTRLGHTLAPHLGRFGSWSSQMAFLLIWMGVPLVLSVLAELLTSFFELIHLGLLNHLAGVGLGVLKYAFLLSCLLNGLSLTGLIDETQQDDSVLYTPLKAPAAFVFRKCKHEVEQHLNQAYCLDRNARLMLPARANG